MMRKRISRPNARRAMKMSLRETDLASDSNSVLPSQKGEAAHRTMYAPVKPQASQITSPVRHAITMPSSIPRFCNAGRDDASMYPPHAISQYQNMDEVRGPRRYLRLAERNARMCGFTVDHYAARFGEAVPKLAAWMQSGELVLPEHVEQGIDRFPAALNLLFTGGHTGKLLVKP